MKCTKGKFISKFCLFRNILISLFSISLYSSLAYGSSQIPQIHFTPSTLEKFIKKYLPTSVDKYKKSVQMQLANDGEVVFDFDQDEIEGMKSLYWVTQGWNWSKDDFKMKIKYNQLNAFDLGLHDPNFDFKVACDPSGCDLEVPINHLQMGGLSIDLENKLTSRPLPVIKNRPLNLQAKDGNVTKLKLRIERTTDPYKPFMIRTDQSKLEFSQNDQKQIDQLVKLATTASDSPFNTILNKTLNKAGFINSKLKKMISEWTIGAIGSQLAQIIGHIEQQIDSYGEYYRDNPLMNTIFPAYAGRIKTGIEIAPQLMDYVGKWGQDPNIDDFNRHIEIFTKETKAKLPQIIATEESKVKKNKDLLAARKNEILNSIFKEKLSIEESENFYPLFEDAYKHKDDQEQLESMIQQDDVLSYAQKNLLSVFFGKYKQGWLEWGKSFIYDSPTNDDLMLKAQQEFPNDGYYQQYLLEVKRIYDRKMRLAKIDPSGELRENFNHMVDNPTLSYKALAHIQDNIDKVQNKLVELKHRHEQFQTSDKENAEVEVPKKKKLRSIDKIKNDFPVYLRLIKNQMTKSNALRQIEVTQDKVEELIQAYTEGQVLQKGNIKYIQYITQLNNTKKKLQNAKAKKSEWLVTKSQCREYEEKQDKLPYNAECEALLTLSNRHITKYEGIITESLEKLLNPASMADDSSKSIEDTQEYKDLMVMIHKLKVLKQVIIAKDYDDKEEGHDAKDIISAIFGSSDINESTLPPQANDCEKPRRKMMNLAQEGDDIFAQDNDFALSIPHSTFEGIITTDQKDCSKNDFVKVSKRTNICLKAKVGPQVSLVTNAEGKKQVKLTFPQDKLLMAFEYGSRSIFGIKGKANLPQVDMLFDINQCNRDDKTDKKDLCLEFSRMDLGKIKLKGKGFWKLVVGLFSKYIQRDEVQQKITKKLESTILDKLGDITPGEEDISEDAVNEPAKAIKARIKKLGKRLDKNQHENKVIKVNLTNYPVIQDLSLDPQNFTDDGDNIWVKGNL